jgi:hypothetical protein
MSYRQVTVGLAFVLLLGIWIGYVFEKGRQKYIPHSHCVTPDGKHTARCPCPMMLADGTEIECQDDDPMTRPLASP